MWIIISEATQLYLRYLLKLRKTYDIINAILLFIYLESEAEQHVVNSLI